MPGTMTENQKRYFEAKFNEISYAREKERAFVRSSTNFV